ncbi:MAG: TerB family tellurite resistance protein [bacterium]|jgi:uncharacterized membrane protein YebE (DUF533 family)
MSAQMLTGLQPEILNEQQKTWFAVAVCHAIVADGNIDPSELSYLEQALSFLSSKTQVDSLMQAVKDQKLPKLDKFPSATRELEVKIFIELALITTADDVISTREIDFLMNVGRILGFGREFAKVLIRWASEGIIWRNKMHKIIDSGVELHPEYIT